jgi:hypothetical protein
MASDEVKRRTRGRVEDQPQSLTIRRLKDLGLLHPGCLRTHSFPQSIPFTFSCDLRSDMAFFRVECGPMVQFIELVPRTVGRGTRWFFREGDTGIVCEKMYACEGRYVSRQTAGLAYQSQLRSKFDRIVGRGERAAEALVGVYKGPARGASRERKLETLKQSRQALRKFNDLVKQETEKKNLRRLSKSSCKTVEKGSNLNFAAFEGRRRRATEQ